MQAKHSRGKGRFRDRLMHLLRLNPQPQVKVYDGYGNGNSFTLFGHVLKLSPYGRKKYRNSFLRNSVALMRLFMVKPIADVLVRLHVNGSVHEVRTDEDGFFKFDWEDKDVSPGWLPVKVTAFENDTQVAASDGKVYVPAPSAYIFISDIDDTFLVSHSRNIVKRLFVLFRNNARSRKPFDGVVKHYRLLQQWNEDVPANPFFYVSSSEWNLYDYLVEFTRIHRLPAGIFLLNRLKRFSALLKTGQNNHQTKFTRIARILEAFPGQGVVLLGDSSQQDPYIYQALVKHFPKQIRAVYIRDVYHRSRDVVSGVMQQIEAAGVPCCFFVHSEDAILHSVKVGLIPAAVLSEEKIS